MELRFLGGADEIGRSALLVNGSLLLDFGLQTSTPLRYPLDADPDAVVVSHAHLDHAGAVPALLSGAARPPIHWTPPTRALAMVLARDTLKLHGNTPQCRFTETNLRRVTQVSQTHSYRDPFEAAGHEVTLFDAGHIPGSAHVLVDDGETRLLCTADFHTDDQRLVAGTRARPEADIVLTESTYSDTTHEDRDRVEQRFIDSVRTTIWEGGTVVVPAFAIGRTQEILLLLADSDIDCYVDGMGVEVTRLLRQHPEFLRDHEALKRASANARTVTGRDGQRERIADTNTVIVTTAGMLNGGPALSYIPEIRSHPTNKIAMTGYQVPGTPGRELLETGRLPLDNGVVPVSAQVEQYDFSAHADREGLCSFLDAYRDTPVLVVHGDDCESFADQLRTDGYEASAPAVGDQLTVG